MPNPRDGDRLACGRLSRVGQSPEGAYCPTNASIRAAMCSSATRLADALASGLSGAVLVATEDIQPKKTSDAIHEIELPTLLELGEDPRFTLAVVATVPRMDDLQRADRTRTAKLYERPETEALTHYSSLDSSLDNMGAALAKQRLRQLRAARSDALTIDIQTRRASTAFASDADLVFRTVPPVESRAPGRAVWEDLQRFLTWLPTAVADHGPPEVRLVGGAHLSVALACGAALPETAGIPLSVRTTEGSVWRPTADRLSWRERLPLIGSAPSVRRPWSGDGSALAVFLDLVPSLAVPSFVPYLEANRSDFAEGVVVDLNRRLEGRWYLTTKTMATLMTPSSLIAGPRTTLPAP